MLATQCIRPWRIYAEELAADPSRYIILFRHSMGPELLSAGVLPAATAVWMMWPGYLERARGTALKQWLTDNGIEMTTAHASGHATVADLQRIAEAIDAGRIVPIHTSSPQLYADVFDAAEPHPDGEWWTV